MRPPALAQALIAAAAPEHDYEIVAGDLHEEYLSVLSARGTVIANRWYWAQALLSLPALLTYSRSNPSVLRRASIALIAFGVLVAMVVVVSVIETVTETLFGSASTSSCWVWPFVIYGDAIAFGAVLARLVRSDGVRIAFFASLFLVACFVVPALAGNPHSQAPLSAWIQLAAVVPAMCFGAGLYQAVIRRTIA
jgi:hypothetical protein